jgi:hypothetical protein
LAQGLIVRENRPMQAYMYLVWSEEKGLIFGAAAVVHDPELNTCAAIKACLHVANEFLPHSSPIH